MHIPLFDLSKLKEMAKGDEQFVYKMVQLFIDKIPMSVAEIKVGFDSGDYDKVKAVAHRIKPSIDFMGIDSLKNEIIEIENNAEIFQSSEQMEKLIYKLDSVINEVVDSLKQLAN